MGILQDLMHTGVNMGLGYGMNQLGNYLGSSPSQAQTAPDRAVPSATNTDQSALGSSGLGGLDPLSKLALKNMMQSGIGGMMPQQGGGMLSSSMGGILSALPGILSLL